MHEATARSKGTVHQEVVTGSHRLVADVPPPEGGDAGPAPGDLLVAALASCAAMTMRLYANRKGWPVETIEVHVRHEGETLHKTVRLTGPLDGEQRKRLLEIAGRCPVHKAISTPHRIVDTLAP
jgi:putative redox protein